MNKDDDYIPATTQRTKERGIKTEAHTPYSAGQTPLKPKYRAIVGASGKIYPTHETNEKLNRELGKSVQKGGVVAAATRAALASTLRGVTDGEHAAPEEGTDKTQASLLFKGSPTGSTEVPAQQRAAAKNKETKDAFLRQSSAGEEQGKTLSQQNKEAMENFPDAGNPVIATKLQTILDTSEAITSPGQIVPDGQNIEKR